LLAQKWPEPDLSPDENQLFAQFEKAVQKIENGSGAIQKIAPPKLCACGRKQNKAAGKLDCRKSCEARRLLDAAAEKAEVRYQQEQERIKTEFESTVRNIKPGMASGVRGAMDLRDTRPIEADERAAPNF